jgi:hypothetical protein
MMFPQEQKSLLVEKMEVPFRLWMLCSIASFGDLRSPSESRGKDKDQSREQVLILRNADLFGSAYISKSSMDRLNAKE